MDENRIPRTTPPASDTTAVTQLRRIADALERFLALYDEATGARLNAKYPFGQPRDRWRRGA